MSIVSRFKSMPQLLVVLVLLGLLSPFLAFISVWTGNIVSGDAGEYVYGAAKNIYELGGVVLLTIPIFVASILMIRKKIASIYFYLIGWVAICLSPLCLSVINENLYTYLIELLVYIAIGVVIGIFLFRSKGVESYFLNDFKNRD